ncbi:hypothetical protein [Streptomyces griseofuscus]|uniref:hypothetical protein n=1 Tax=Streptomyces griseofuscus TaxID=146922 RepID=UPI0033C3F3C1
MSRFVRLAFRSSAVALALTSTLAAAPQVEAAAGDAPAVVVSDWSGRGEVAYASCPQGTSLVGGGYDSNPDHLGSGVIADAVNTNAPSASRPNTWAVRMDRGQVKAYAMCD